MQQWRRRRSTALRATVALGALVLAAVLTATALGTDRDARPAPIEVAAGTVPGGDGGPLRTVDPARVETITGTGGSPAPSGVDGPTGDAASGAAPTASDQASGAVAGGGTSPGALPVPDPTEATVPSLPLPTGSTTTTIPSLLDELLGLLPLPGTTTTTAPTGGDEGLLPGLPLPDLGLGG